MANFKIIKPEENIIIPKTNNLILPKSEIVGLYGNQSSEEIYGENAWKVYVPETISFCNTREFSRAAQHFKKHGVYTFAPDGSRDYEDYWNEEERRRVNGMTLPGKLINGKLQEVTITGEYYSFLNYGRIYRTVDKDDKELYNLLKDSHLLKNARKTGKKDIDFPDFWEGHYHYTNAKAYAAFVGLHMIVAKSRRKGYSYIEAFDSANEVNLNAFVTILVGAFALDYITKGNQMMGMAKRYLDFFETHTDFGRGFLSELNDNIKLGYKDPISNIHKGYLSQILAVSFGPANPEAAIGKDAKKIKLEECGKFPNLLQSLGVTTSTTEDGELTTGQITMFGVPGAKDGNWEDFEKIFYNPFGHDCLAFENIWDDNARGTQCGFFFPQRQNLIGHIDEHGNSNYETADIAIEKNRENKKSSLDPIEYQRYISQRANKPQEAFSISGDSFFPKQLLEEQLNKVIRDPTIKYVARIGILDIKEGKVILKVDDTVSPITDFPIKSGQSLNGAIVEWQPPFLINGQVPSGLYRAWCDPYATSKDVKNMTLRDSLGSIYIYERINTFTPTRGDVLVAAYVGRPSLVDTYNEEGFRLIQRYKAIMQFENNRGNIYEYAKNHRKLEWLADEPTFTWNKELAIKSGQPKGIHINDKRKETGALYLRDWLITPRGNDKDGNTLLNLNYIYDEALLRELIKWNLKGNFDRVSALIVGMYDVKEVFNIEIEEAKTNDKTGFFDRQLFK